MKYFYHNFVFSTGIPREQYEKSWHEWPWLFFLPTYVQIGDGIAYFYKQWGNQYYLLKEERVGAINQ